MKAQKDQLLPELNRNQALFKSLFFFQMELQNHQNESEFRDELQLLILHVDELMEAMICEKKE